jgi:hypothetical protein
MVLDASLPGWVTDAPPAADDTQRRVLQPVRVTLRIGIAMVLNPRHDKFWLLAALAFGLFVLPFLVHMTGLFVFGKYANGGAGAFFGDFLRGLATMRWYSWCLALGPLVLVGVWRLLWRATATASRG